MKLRPVIRLGLLLAMATGLAGEVARPNVLWIVAEDLSPDFGVFVDGDAVARTPNLDRFAAEAVRYTRAFATAGACSPSRSAFNTGLHQIRIGAHHHRIAAPNRPALPAGVRPAPEWFREAGYFVSSGRPGDDAGMPADQPAPLDWNFQHPAEPFDGLDWSERQPGQPFFAQIHLKPCFRPFKRDMQHPVDPSRVSPPPYFPDHPMVRIDWALYLEQIQRLDARIGAVLDRLEREGLAGNTWVFFFSDHGRPFARDTGYLYDGALRVPLLVRAPDGARAGEVDRRLVSLVDLLPTSLAAVGLPVPPGFDGRSFARSHVTEREAVFAAKDRIGATPDRVRAIRTRDYKYIRNFHPEQPYLPVNRYTLITQPSLAALLHLAAQGEGPPIAQILAGPNRPAEELYDLQRDPHELHNLAQDPAHAAALADLRGRLDAWIVATGDQGRVPEPPEGVAAYRRWLDGYLDKVLREKGVETLEAAAMFEYWNIKYDLGPIGR